MLCKYCEKAVKDTVESIGYYTNMLSKKIYQIESLKRVGMIERVIKEDLSKEAKDFIRSFHRNKLLRLFMDTECSLEPFVNWIESIEKKTQLKN